MKETIQFSFFFFPKDNIHQFKLNQKILKQYVGEFKFDEKVNGTFRWKGGDTYTGEWKNSLMHGKGTYTYKNGRMYKGDWVAGYKQGFGENFFLH